MNRHLVNYVRYPLPTAVAIAGVSALVFGNGTWQVPLGIALLGLAILIVAANILSRVAIDRKGDRDADDRARRTGTR